MCSSAQVEASLYLKESENKEFLRAKDYAYRLLSYRQRSTGEITQRLKAKGFTSKVVAKTVKYLSELDYLNDENFARAWVRTKMRLKPAGWPLLRYQLRQKGVADEITEKVISDFAGRYDEIDVARKVAASRRPRYKGIEPLKLKKRLYDYLRRRGFSQEAILQAIK